VSQVRILPGALEFPRFIDRCYGAAMGTLGYVLAFGAPLLVCVAMFVFMRVARQFMRVAGQRNRFEGPALTGTARVESLKGTSIETGSSHLCDFRLLVDVPGHSPYDVSLSWPVHPVNIPRVQPGATVPVEVDSANLQKVRITL
jgi:hypothetical protein